jgi:hypothetical protein
MQTQRDARPGATSVGREREAVSVAVTALARHLPCYQRAMANYARLLVEPS